MLGIIQYQDPNPDAGSALREKLPNPDKIDADPKPCVCGNLDLGLESDGNQCGSGPVSSSLFWIMEVDVSRSIDLEHNL